MDGGAWRATVHGVSKSQTQLSDLTFTFFVCTSLFNLTRNQGAFFFFSYYETEKAPPASCPKLVGIN